ncbi:uncharacterized protein C8Q71DRAFT_273701 [Rhodofomes roseus]|uniref:Uncharacterized protein n=1 Tax=Rhodofomes roseus TaxID=34475 RepID=A0ABQ8K4U0_9APHY|nr:uncharacterized protein C8Q71DRAFT_273701 [Rhodofomes roseus]KAH9831937.1 hypothetical protein C8Q71DRAFT_273701 [Rhodofomes roseus]
MRREAVRTPARWGTLRHPRAHPRREAPRPRGSPPPEHDTDKDIADPVPSLPTVNVAFTSPFGVSSEYLGHHRRGGILLQQTRGFACAVYRLMFRRCLATTNMRCRTIPPPCAASFLVLPSRTPGPSTSHASSLDVCRSCVPHRLDEPPAKRRAAAAERG